MLTTLTYISFAAGGILILLLLLSLLGGLDLDLDIGDSDVSADAGGLGLIKGILTFVSVTSWVIKLVIVSQQSLWVAVIIGCIAGGTALWLLSFVFRTLLKNQENVNWSMRDALYQRGTVYLRIPPAGSGIVYIEVKGVRRELKAKSNSEEEIKTGASIYVTDIEDEYVIVEPA